MPYTPRITPPLSDEEFVVERILDIRGRGRGTEYLIKWEGYDEPSWTWARYANCRELVRAYHRRRRGSRGSSSPDHNLADSDSSSHNPSPVVLGVDLLPEEAREGERVCLCCLTNRPTHIVQPCNHAVLCSSCVLPVATLHGCPKCRAAMERIAPFYLD